MSDLNKFKESIQIGYDTKGESIIVGGAMLDGECLHETFIKIPLKTINRHGLIAGATGTGKTKTLQIFTEQLSEHGVPVLLMDLKGDLSGLARPGEVKEFISFRHEKLGLEYSPKSLPVEFLSISKEPGVRLRATVTEFGPILLSKILELNDTQSGVVSLIFRYCDENNLALVDLKDFKKVLQHVIGEGKEAIQNEYGAVSATTVNIILRKIIELEQQGAEMFFGETSFDVNDLTRTSVDGKGVVSIIRLTDIQDKPKLFSTFMLSLLAEIYASFPEQGDSEKPKLVLFIDEAHLVFDQASKTLIDQIESIVRLIRSKGVGIFFCTQNPSDVPEAILSQLGLKVQHALRAFTANDRKNIKQIAENFPITEHFKIDEALTSMGIGEALITALNEKGVPTPLAVTYLRAPVSRMGILTVDELERELSKSKLFSKYKDTIDRESAFEILSKKMMESKLEQIVEKPSNSNAKKEVSTIEQLTKNPMVRQIGRTIFQEITRGLLGALGLKRRRY